MKNRFIALLVIVLILSGGCAIVDQSLHESPARRNPTWTNNITPTNVFSSADTNIIQKLNTLEETEGVLSNLISTSIQRSQNSLENFDSRVLSVSDNINEIKMKLKSVSESDEQLHKSLDNTIRELKTSVADLRAQESSMISKLDKLQARSDSISKGQKKLLKTFNGKRETPESTKATINGQDTGSTFENLIPQIKALLKNIDSLIKKLNHSPYELLVRALEIPIILWITQVLIANAIRRYNTIKTLQVDITHRTADAISGLKKLQEWQTEIKSVIGSPKVDLKYWPLLKPIAEDHVLYKSVQPEIVHCLWGKEIQDVREVYRWLDDVEVRLKTINDLNDQFIEYVADRCCEESGKEDECLGSLGALFKKDIDENIKRYEESLQSLLRDDCKIRNDADQDWNGTEDKERWHYGTSDCQHKLLCAFSNKIFLGRGVAYLSQLFAPLFFTFSVFFITLIWQSHTTLRIIFVELDVFLGLCWLVMIVRTHLKADHPLRP